MLYIAVLLAVVVGDRDFGHGAQLLAASFPLVALVVLHGHDASVERLKTTFLDVVASVVGAVSLTAMVVLAAASIFDVAHPLGLLLRVWLYCCVYLSIARYMLVLIRRHAIAVDAFATPTLIVGAGVIGSHLANRLMGDASYGLRPVGLLDPDPLRDPHSTDRTPVPLLSGDGGLAAAVLTTGARHVILAFSSEPDHLLAPKVRECQALGVEVALVPRMYESINERTTLDHVGGLPVLTLHTVDPRGWQFAIKHALDRAGAALILLLCSPLLVLLSVLIRLSSPGPMLFRQRRVGRDGH